MATESRQSLAKVKPGSRQEGSSKEKVESSMKNSKPQSVSTVTKTEVKSKTTTSSSRKTTTTTTTRVREKKVYSMPGQKYDPPEEREPLRIFYQSLSKQNPTSEMAEFWMMEHGLLSPVRAKKAYEKKQRKQKMQRMGTPVKSSKPAIKPENSKKQQQASKKGEMKAKKRIIKDSDDEDKFILSPRRRKA